jgi:uncharacterized protein
VKHIVLCLLMVWMTPVSWGADFDKGLTAAQNGDFTTALREWTPLAEQGNADAQTSLGIMYRRGEGVIQDDATAVKWYTLAAEQGNASAQALLGTMYFQGTGVIQDDATAVKWFTRAAEQGNASAQVGLALMYSQGTGVIQDNVYAHLWFNIAASLGNETAIELRDLIVQLMTPADISKAQQLARECVAKNYKGC